MDPDFACEPWVYWDYSEAGTGPQAGLSGTAVARGRLVGNRLLDVAMSYGCNYGELVGDACRIGGGRHGAGQIEPVSYWVPTSIAPSGLAFYTGNGFPAWRGQVFIGALAGAAWWRIELNGNVEVAREKLFADLQERIRDVRQGPDGWLYLLTDSGKLIQVRN